MQVTYIKGNERSKDMKPVKMEITNFKGLKGKRTIRFYPLMAYCLPNAAGKTERGREDIAL